MKNIVSADETEIKRIKYMYLQSNLSLCDYYYYRESYNIIRNAISVGDITYALQKFLFYYF